MVRALGLLLWIPACEGMTRVLAEGDFVATEPSPGWRGHDEIRCLHP